jgi:hypothetical protein
MFHAVGLNVIDARERRRDLWSKSTIPPKFEAEVIVRKQMDGRRLRTKRRKKTASLNVATLPQGQLT